VSAARDQNPRWGRLCLTTLSVCGRGVGSVCLWVLWLALAIVLCLQLGIAVSRELSVPKFILRSIEERLDASQMRVSFGRAELEPSGRILLSEVQVFLPEFAEPIATSRAIQLQLDPWALLVGSVETRQIEIADLTLYVPAMLAPSGRSEELLRGADLLVRPRDQGIQIAHASGRLGDLALTLAGSFRLPPRSEQGDDKVPVTELIARNYGRFCRQVRTEMEKLAGVQQPIVHITLEPSLTRGAVATVVLLAEQISWPGNISGQVRDVRVETRLPVIPDGPFMLPTRVSFEEAQLTSGERLTDAILTFRANVRIGEGASPIVREAELVAREIAAHGTTLTTPLVRLHDFQWPRARVETTARLLDLPFEAAARVDLVQRTASIDFEGALSPRVMDEIETHTGRDLSRYLAFGEPVKLAAHAEFDEGWRFRDATGRFDARVIHGYGVTFDRVTGEFEIDPQRAHAHHLLGRIGENFARGEFTQDFSSLAYRFLLDGRLRPMDISPWFHSWWSNFFEQLDFPAEPPAANVDVSGRWRHGRETAVFVWAQSRAPRIREVTFDEVLTRLFIRPHFMDGLELVGRRAGQSLSGTFERHADRSSGEWSEITMDFASTLDLPSVRQLLGETAGQHLDAFEFERAPEVTVRGRLLSEHSPEGPHQTLRISAASPGGFAFHRFPFQGVRFSATVKDGDVTVHELEAGVADGKLSGTAHVWGPDAERRLGFDASLTGARLGRAVATVEQFAAVRAGQSGKTREKFLPGQNSARLDLALSAEGRFADLLSFDGTGNAMLTGAELGEVRLLGLLSELLNFTAVRFTTARTHFQLKGPLILFPEVNITGPSAAIDAHGTYAIDQRELDFRGRINPFQESETFLGSVFDTVLSPLSSVLEVKLTGPLDKPNWAFVMGPTNLLRNLTQPGSPSRTEPSPLSPQAPTNP